MKHPEASQRSSAAVLDNSSGNVALEESADLLRFLGTAAASAICHRAVNLRSCQTGLNLQLSKKREYLTQGSGVEKSVNQEETTTTVPANQEETLSLGEISLERFFQISSSKRIPR